MSPKLYAWQFKNPQFKPIVQERLVDVHVPFGVEGLKAIHNTCKESGLSAEDVLLANVLHRLKLALYTKKDIERVLKEDDLAGQIIGQIEKNRKMLSFGEGGVYKTMKFRISPREIPEAIQ